MTESLAARWEQHHEAGRQALSHGLLSEAEHALAAAVSEAEQLGPDSPQLGTSLNALGQLRTQTRDYAGAEACLTRALAIRERAFGSDGQALVPTLNALAALHDARNEHERAASLLRRALGISEHHLGPSHPEVSVGLNNLAKLYFKRRDFAKADRLLLRLLEIKRGLGKDHPEVATVLGSLGKLRQAVGKPDHGVHLWRQALAIRERCFAPNDPVIATTLENLADCCAALEGRVAEAIMLRERALAIREHATGGVGATISAARAKLQELRARDIPSAPPAEPLPRRSSQELPSPILSDEVPAFLRDEEVQRPSGDLPWLDTEDNGRISGTFDRLAPNAPIGRRTPAASVTPLAVPRQSPSVAPIAFGAPPVVPPSLVLSDSIAPEPPAREKPRDPHSGRGTRYVPSSESHKTASGRASRYVAPDPDSTAPVAQRRRPRMPAEMSRRGSSKRLVVFGLLVAIVAGSGWVMRGRLEVATRPLIQRAVSLGETAQRAIPQTLDAQPAGTRRQARDSTPQSTPASPGVSPRSPQRGSDADSVREAAPDDRIARARAAGATGGRVEHRTQALDSVTPVRSSPDEALLLKKVPSVGDGSEIDALTADVEHATKSKIESAQKSLKDVKPPVFKTP